MYVQRNYTFSKPRLKVFPSEYRGGLWNPNSRRSFIAPRFFISLPRSSPSLSVVFFFFFYSKLPAFSWQTNVDRIILTYRSTQHEYAAEFFICNGVLQYVLYLCSKKSEIWYLGKKTLQTRCTQSLNIKKLNTWKEQIARSEDFIFQVPLFSFSKNQKIPCRSFFCPFFAAFHLIS